jgi:ribonuclease P protein component
MENLPSSLPQKNITIKKMFSLAYCERLHSRRDFNRVFRYGLKLKSRSVVILAYRRNDGYTIRRLGLVTPKNIGTSVIRNRTKRRLREIFRTNKHSLEYGIDLIFIPKPGVVLLDYNILKEIILNLLKDAKIYIGPL